MTPQIQHRYRFDTAIVRNADTESMLHAQLEETRSHHLRRPRRTASVHYLRRRFPYLLDEKALLPKQPGALFEETICARLHYLRRPAAQLRETIRIT